MMPAKASGLAPVRAQIPPELVHDFDFFAPPGAAEDVHLAWKRLHEVGPRLDTCCRVRGSCS